MECVIKIKYFEEISIKLVIPLMIYKSFRLALLLHQ